MGRGVIPAARVNVAIGGRGIPRGGHFDSYLRGVVWDKRGCIQQVVKEENWKKEEEVEQRGVFYLLGLEKEVQARK
jgi:hypothetical protein